MYHFIFVILEVKVELFLNLKNIAFFMIFWNILGLDTPSNFQIFKWKKYMATIIRMLKS